jgi:predicted GNAT family acetyltransferase
VTLLRPDVRRHGRVQILGDESPRPLLAEFGRLVDADPIVNVVVRARLDAARSLAPSRLGGDVLAVVGDTGIRGACFAGGNLLPIGGDADAWRQLARFLALGPRPCSSIVGCTDAVEAMWDELEHAWGPERAIRSPQPLLVTDTAPLVPADSEVHRARGDELERYLPAAAAMFTEELGVSPHVSPGTAAFHARMRHLISAGRAFVSTDFRGQVVFKAEIAAVSAHTAQVQGVWVRPDLRGRGIGTAGLAAVIAFALELAPSVSLYVNDFNVPAMKMYQRLGMRQHAELTTILLP